MGERKAGLRLGESFLEVGAQEGILLVVGQVGVVEDACILSLAQGSYLTVRVYVSSSR